MTNRSKVFRVGVPLLLVTSGLTAAVSSFGAQAPTRSSSISGAGFANVVAFAPKAATPGQQRVAVGGDVSGVHISDDDGVTWKPANRGLQADEDAAVVEQHVAALSFTPSSADELWALVGDGITGNGRLLHGSYDPTSQRWAWFFVAGRGTTNWTGKTVFTVDGTNGRDAASLAAELGYGDGSKFYGQKPRPVGALLETAATGMIYAMRVIRGAGSDRTSRDTDGVLT